MKKRTVQKNRIAIDVSHCPECGSLLSERKYWAAVLRKRGFVLRRFTESGKCPVCGSPQPKEKHKKVDVREIDRRLFWRP